MEFTLSCCSRHVLGTMPVLFITKTKVRGSTLCWSINIYDIKLHLREVKRYVPSWLLNLYKNSTQTRTSVLTQSSGHHWKGWTQDQDGHTATNDLHIRAEACKVLGRKKPLFSDIPTHALHVKLVPHIVRLVPLKLLITRFPLLSFQSLSLKLHG